MSVGFKAPDPVDARAWRAGLLDSLGAGARAVTLFGRSGEDGRVVLTALLEDTPGRLSIRRTTVDPADGYHTLTDAFPALHVFEREIHEQVGVRVAGHPWMKPVRFEGGGGQSAMNAYPFYTVTGKDVHEVAVGPIHAGVIEPGSFRFMCHGERVLHLEIHLGYQHRGVERLLLEGDPRRLAPLVETIAGDTSIAHTWAYVAAIERLGGCVVAPATEMSRGLLLELERIGMHLATLSGIAADIGFLQGATTYGRLRTTAINTTMRLCGSRFGRGGVRLGAPGYALDTAALEMVTAALASLEADLPSIDDRFLSDPTVQHRLRHVGVVSSALAAQLGLVGVVGRASGIAGDQRVGGLYTAHPVAPQEEASGDCWARARVRISEIHASLRWIRALLHDSPRWARARVTVGPLSPSELVVSVIEGWRGEVVHCVETDETGAVCHYKVQDPSLRNWMGLAMAVRGNAISDFPICNKSFDLSYCGNDL